MMAQYLALKDQAPDCLLFYRMGDFFELFFDDARQAAQILDIALTSRGEHGGAPIPMCGVPVHSAESYLARLIRAGCRVAIAEQVETPEEAKKRGGSKALVARDIVRFVTAGTLTEEALLNPRESNVLVAICPLRESVGWPPATFRPARWSWKNAPRRRSAPRSPGFPRAKWSARRTGTWPRPRRSRVKAACSTARRAKRACATSMASPRSTASAPFRARCWRRRAG
jgi:DNA mismatch repair protein MutS